MELFEQIRREYEHGEGTIAGVARKFGVHRRMVRQAHLLHHDGGSHPFSWGCSFENGLVTRFFSTRAELEVSSAWA